MHDAEDHDGELISAYIARIVARQKLHVLQFPDLSQTRIYSSIKRE